MAIHVDIQLACTSEEPPDEDSIRHWVAAAIGNRREEAELSVRIVDLSEGRALNQQYRGAQGATNVLSFPFEAPLPELLALLGDVVVCAPVVAEEARQQQKEPAAHWAHMIIHGVLHLLGFDHQNDSDAAIMENLETDILQGLGFPPPYTIH